MVTNGFEIDFLPVDSGEKNGDAIAARVRVNGTDTIYVVDGGTKASGQLIVDHCKKYYSTTRVDYLINTHPDNDHVSGLTVVAEQMSLGEVWMHQPWNLTDQIIDFIVDGRITESSLSRRLEEALKQAVTLRDIVNENGIEIKSPYQGSKIGHFTVLSPSRAWYIELLKNFDKMPETESPRMFDGFRQIISEAAKKFEDWGFETLSETAETSPQNETSVILYANLFGKGLLLTGDAGVKSLTKAHEFALTQMIDLKSCAMYQVPHHGSRHNVNPTLLNKLLGAKLPNQTAATRWAYASVSSGAPDYPRHSVSNAFKRRGVDVIKTAGFTKYYFNGFTLRDGWSTVAPLPFYSEVEA